jgi:hypothetical protein
MEAESDLCGVEEHIGFLVLKMSARMLEVTQAIKSRILSKRLKIFSVGGVRSLKGGFWGVESGWA